MQFAISYLASLVIAIVLVTTGWKRRPATRPAKVTSWGWATLALGGVAALTALPMVTAAVSIVLSGLALIAGSIALIRHDTHRWTVIGQCVALLPALLWLVFLIAEVTFPH